jgi:hypothetical protein
MLLEINLVWIVPKFSCNFKQVPFTNEQANNTIIFWRIWNLRLDIYKDEVTSLFFSFSVLAQQNFKRLDKKKIMVREERENNPAMVERCNSCANVCCC